MKHLTSAGGLSEDGAAAHHEQYAHQPRTSDPAPFRHFTERPPEPTGAARKSTRVGTAPTTVAPPSGQNRNQLRSADRPTDRADDRLASVGRWEDGRQAPRRSFDSTPAAMAVPRREVCLTNREASQLQQAVDLRRLTVSRRPDQQRGKIRQQTRSRLAAIYI